MTTAVSRDATPVEGEPEQALATRPTPPHGGPRLGRGAGRFASISTRIVVAYLALLAGAIVLSLLFIRQALLVRLDQQISSHLVQEQGEFRSLAGGIDPTTAEPFGTDLEGILDVYFDRNVPNEGEVLLGIVDGRAGQDHLVYEEHASDAPFDPRTNDQLVQEWSRVTDSESATTVTDEGDPVTYSAVAIRAQDRRLGVFVVANFPAAERAEVNTVVQVGALMSGVVLLVASLIAWTLTRGMLRPLRELTSTTESISVTDLTRRIPVHGRDEVARLARTFNDMLERLEQAFAVQRGFVDDAGHELRTPITIIRGHLELLEEDEDPVERRRTMTLVLDELDRMSRMVNDLLLLAKAEQPDFLNLGTVDIEALTQEVRSKAGALAPRDWRTEGRSRGIIVGDRQRLTQALVQLADNAARHTGHGDAIWIGSALVDGEARLWVRDSGPGVAAQDRDRIFGRFARSTRVGGGEGTGLGLAIVKAIAEAHHGRIEVGGAPGTGAQFTMFVPVDQPPAAEPTSDVHPGRLP